MMKLLFQVFLFPFLMFANLVMGSQTTINTLKPFLGHSEGGNSNLVTTTIGLPKNFAITPDGTKAYMTDVNNDRVIPIDLATMQVQTPIVSPEFKKPIAIAITPDGQQALVTNLETNSVTLINLTVTPPLVEKTIEVSGVNDQKSQGPGCTFVTITVTPSQNPVCVGVPVDFSAVFSGFTPTSTPGTLSYFIDLVLINTVNVNDIGIAPDSDSITASPGLHLVYATYSGDDVNCSFTSTPILFTVNATAITASADPNPICAGQMTTLSATDFPAGATGTVTFSIGATELCTATLPETSCTTSVSTTGPQTVTATYSGDINNCRGSTTFTLNVRTLTTTTASASPNPVGEGQPVTLSATVTSSGPTPTGTVTFSIGSTLICTATLNGGTGACTSSTIPVGTQIITASYNGDANNCPSSTTFTVVVDVISFIVTSSPDPSCAGESVTLSATVTSTTGFVPTGTLAFSIGFEALCTATLSGGSGSCSTDAIPTGTQTITAVYSGDVHNSSAMTTFMQVVRPNVPDARVIQCVIRFATQLDRVNIVTWEAPNDFEAVIYLIFHDAELRELIGVVPVDYYSSPEGSFRFEDHNRKKNHTYRYFIIGMDAFGNETCPSEVVFERVPK